MAWYICCRRSAHQMPIQVSVSRAEGAVQEPGSLLSIRVGSSRRQGSVQLCRPCRFPERISDSTPARVDVMRRVGCGQVEISPEDETYSVPIKASSSSSSSSISLKLRVKNAPRLCGRAKPLGKQLNAAEPLDGHIKESELISPDSPLGVAAQSRRYLDEHNILQVVQVLLEALVTDQPEEPREYIASFLDRLQIDQQSTAKTVEALLLNRKGEQAQLDELARSSFPQWAAIYDSVDSSGSGNLDLQGFVVAIRKVYPHLAVGQAEAVGRGVSPNGAISFSAFTHAVTALRDGSAAAAALAGLSTEQFNTLAEQQHEKPASALTPKGSPKRHGKDEKIHFTLDPEQEHKVAENDVLQEQRSSSAQQSQGQCGVHRRKSRPLHDSSPPIRALELLCGACADGRLEQALRFVMDDEEEGDMELETPPPEVSSKRRGGVSAEVFGGWNVQKSGAAPKIEKTPEQRLALQKALQACPLFLNKDLAVIDMVVDAMALDYLSDGACIIRQGDEAKNAELFCLLDGEADCFNAAVSNEEDPRGQFVRTMPAGRVFGEMSMLFCIPRSRSVYAKGDCVMGKLSQDTYQGLMVREARKSKRKREEILKHVTMFETLNSEQIGKIAETLEKREYEAEAVIIKQGSLGKEFFVMLSGECVAHVETGLDPGNLDRQEHRRYVDGEAFGERAIFRNCARAATITACEKTAVLVLHRSKFERMLGPIDDLHQLHYLSDPRKSIADFYRPGDHRGPRGSCIKKTGRCSLAVEDDPTWSPEKNMKTEWFAIYRPTSREAIAKMLGGHAVGKGLNIKGKSAKKNRLSGFVPFVQISDNTHKSVVEASPPDAWVQLFFASKEARIKAVVELESLLDPEVGLEIDGVRSIEFVDEWTDGVQPIFGIEVPEVVLREAYIMRPDLSDVVGWETGRTSEPAYMNMNLHAIRYHSEPPVVLIQHDAAHPMNPHGLIMAYAEASVKPVVSDFDTFTVGSKHMQYTELCKEQADIAKWSLEQTQEILDTPGSDSWNSRWLEVLKQAEHEGFYPNIPKYGFGDETSYRLIVDVIGATLESGAVRHGAECFNFYFPQELDASYLAIWDGFPDKPWKYLTEPELRDFLKERIDQGYSFPINPVWPVRDPGWYDIFTALREHPETSKVIQAWFPPSSGIADMIEEAHEEFPDGFDVLPVQERKEAKSMTFKTQRAVSRAHFGRHSTLHHLPVTCIKKPAAPRIGSKERLASKERLSSKESINSEETLDSKENTLGRPRAQFRGSVTFSSLKEEDFLERESETPTAPPSPTTVAASPVSGAEESPKALRTPVSLLMRRYTQSALGSAGPALLRLREAERPRLSIKNPRSSLRKAESVSMDEGEPMQMTKSLPIMGRSNIGSA